MNIVDIIRSRRTIQSFLSDEISEEIVQQAIELAILAPNHKLTFPWLFVWVEKASREKLAQVHVDLKSRKKGGETASSVEREAMIKKFMEPAILLMAVIRKSADSTQAEEDYAAMACAIQNMSLYLWNENVGLKWGTGGLIRDERTYEILKLDPKEFKICGTLWIGRARVVPPLQKRPELAKILVRR